MRNRDLELTSDDSTVNGLYTKRPDGGVAQRKSLQNSKTISSNLIPASNNITE